MRTYQISNDGNIYNITVKDTAELRERLVNYCNHSKPIDVSRVYKLTKNIDLVQKSIDKRKDIFYITNGWYSNYLMFYYTPEETKILHKQNLANARAGRFIKKQLIGLDFEIPRQLYTKIINLYIKGGLN